jgi:hypothetical protein
MLIICFFPRLASMGHTVIGIEFVQEAVEQFFQEQNIKYSVKVVDEFKLFTVKIVSK